MSADAPQIPRVAGILVPLSSLRTQRDLGLGEIGALVPMMRLALAMGHRLVQLLPVNETAPGEASPYDAISVFAINPLYVCAEEAGAPASVAAAGARVGQRFVDRAEIRAAKLDLLACRFDEFKTRAAAAERAAFDDFRERNREWIFDYALFRALKHRFSWRSWEEWPAELKRREGPALRRARRELAGPITMYAYWQFLAHRQWAAVRAEAAAMGVMLGGDLAFSPGRDSAEVWANQEVFELNRTVGAPPDAFSPTGQRWGLPMPDWERVRREGLKLWRMRVRHARELYDLLRIDHVVGLYRTFSFGPDPEAPGAFFPQAERDQLAQGEEILRALKEETGAMVLVAEDLGVIPPFVRASLAAMAIPGYKVLRWEKENWGGPDERFISPARYPEVSLATTGTHDTETLVVWWKELSEKERGQLIDALNLKKALSPDDPALGTDGLDAILGALYAAPSRLVVIPLQDLFGWTARINVPGTVRPNNWRWRLPLALERMEASKAVMRRAQRLLEMTRDSGRFSSPSVARRERA